MNLGDITKKSMGYTVHYHKFNIKQFFPLQVINVSP
jgi:hypothetical protein